MKENDIEEARERLEKRIKDIWFSTTDSQEQEEKDLKILLSDYKRVLKENEEKNKMIDSMIKVMIDSSICDYFIKEKCKNYAGENGKICDDCIKQYFENKVKEVR